MEHDEHIERMNGDRSSMIKRTLAWARKEIGIENSLEKDGIKTLYCCEERTGTRTRTVKILEKNGQYFVLDNGKAVHSTRSQGNCVAWCRSRGYLKGNETFIRKAAPAKPQASSSWGVLSIHRGWI